mmetsp:Transcript_56270/g.182658  ORF Transcript_56270/g.182658 Transcript_56270/m.182658 type:complete len:297 (-) Transcript_56270:1185-2075(-)
MRTILGVQWCSIAMSRAVSPLSLLVLRSAPSIKYCRACMVLSAGMAFFIRKSRVSVAAGGTPGRGVGRRSCARQAGSPARGAEGPAPRPGPAPLPNTPRNCCSVRCTRSGSCVPSGPGSITTYVAGADPLAACSSATSPRCQEPSACSQSTQLPTLSEAGSWNIHSAKSKASNSTETGGRPSSDVARLATAVGMPRASARAAVKPASSSPTKASTDLEPCLEMRTAASLLRAGSRSAATSARCAAWAPLEVLVLSKTSSVAHHGHNKKSQLSQQSPKAAVGREGEAKPKADEADAA